ncbi:hypothetical protein ACFFYR_06245 [Paraburkholderia dipogonis]|uniref:hypothetical protein n=1 Tax=Paraburkholderia dipogonis TaxID=1211383 RepID=UPI0035EBDD58
MKQTVSPVTGVIYIDTEAAESLDRAGPIRGTAIPRMYGAARFHYLASLFDDALTVRLFARGSHRKRGSKRCRSATACE